VAYGLNPLHFSSSVTIKQSQGGLSSSFESPDIAGWETLIRGALHRRLVVTCFPFEGTSVISVKGTLRSALVHQVLVESVRCCQSFSTADRFRIEGFVTQNLRLDRHVGVRVRIE
jgi:hypothetical protein